MTYSLIVAYPVFVALFSVLFLWAKNVAEVKPLHAISAVFIVSCVVGVVRTAMTCFDFIGPKYESFSSLLLVMLVFFFQKVKYNIFVNNHRIVTKLFRLLLLSVLVISYYFVCDGCRYCIDCLLGIVSVFLCLVPLFQIILFYIYKNKAKKAFCSVNTPKESDLRGKVYSDKPDIYYIIPDMYMGGYGLRKYCNFDNAEFCDWLIKKGFSVDDCALSNYHQTDVSIPSTLEMEYVQDFFCSQGKTLYENVVDLYNTHHQRNEFVKILKTLGYKYVHLYSWFDENLSQHANSVDVVVRGERTYDFLLKLLEETCLIGLVNAKIRLMDGEHTKMSLQRLLTMHKFKSPKFVFAHVICPHPPFFFDENGNNISSNERIESYPGQIKYVNYILKNAINNILNENPNSAIIIQSDHGCGFACLKKERGTNKPDCITSVDDAVSCFNVFRAIYLPQAKRLGTEVSSSVNTLRVVLNELFDLKLKMKDDKFFCNGVGDYYFKFRDVSHLVRDWQEKIRGKNV